MCVLYTSQLSDIRYTALNGTSQAKWGQNCQPVFSLLPDGLQQYKQ